MNISISNLQRELRNILDALGQNETVTITHKGERMANLVPVSRDDKPIKASEHPAFGMWADRFEDAEVPRLVRHLRKNRFDAV